MRVIRALFKLIVALVFPVALGPTWLAYSAFAFMVVAALMMAYQALALYSRVKRIRDIRLRRIATAQ